MLITEDFRYRVLGALQEYEYILTKVLADRAFCIGKLMEEYGVKDIRNSEAVKDFLSKCAEGSGSTNIDYDVLARAIADGAAHNFSGAPKPEAPHA